MAFSLLPASLPRADPASGVQQRLEQLLPVDHASPASPTAEIDPNESLDLSVRSFYRERSLRPYWVSGNAPTAQAAVLRGYLETAADDGLRPDDYRVAEIRQLWSKRDDQSRAKLELALTRAFLTYANDVSRGRAAAQRLGEPDLPRRSAPLPDPLKPLRKGISAPDLDRFLRAQAPQHPYYQQLKQALQQYRKIAQKAGWRPVPAGAALKPGVSDPRVPLIVERLALTGDLGKRDPASALYDKELEAGVRRFQMRHYLPPDGVIGTATLEAMNIPIAKRIQQIVINMERWRWISLDLSGKQILVNIPGFDLIAIRDGHVELSMPVVVGKPYQQTPVFEDRMEYLEFNPSWMVPPTLAVDELLPELQKDPGALAKKHIRLFLGMGKEAPEVDPKTIDWTQVTPQIMNRYTLRQDPGPWNALGTVKFMFPNKYNVYFHDTSEPRFFGKHLRTFSHGCIRVSRPYELAAWVLDGSASPWNTERVQATVASGRQTTIPLDKPLPVHLLYRTALVDGEQLLHFRPDIYGRDTLLEKALFSS